MQKDLYYSVPLVQREELQVLSVLLGEGAELHL